MSESVPLPNNQNFLLTLRRMREELESLRKEAVARDEMVRSGLAKVGLDGKLIVSNALLAPLLAQVLGIEGRIEGAAAAVERLETWAFDKEGGYEVGARKLTQLDAELRMLRGEGDEMRSVFTAAARARDELTTRVQATENQILIESQKRTELFSKLNIMDGVANELGDGIRANATATSDLTTRVTATEEMLTAVAADVTTLFTEIEVINGNVGGLVGTVNANSQAINTLQSRTTATEGQIQTQADQITTLTSNLSVAQQGIQANATATSGLTTRVTAAEGQISAQAQLITDLGVSVNGAVTTAQNALTASGTNASSITTLRQQGGGGGNQFNYADFSGPSNFVPVAEQWGHMPLQRNLHGETWRVDGTNNYGFTAASGSGYQIYGADQRFPVVPGERVVASAYLAAHGCASYLELWWFNAAGAEIGNRSSSNLAVSVNGGKNIKDWFRAVIAADAPAGAAYCWFVWITTYPTSAMSSWIMRPMFEVGRPGQTAASPWSPSAGLLAGALAEAKQALQAGIDAQGNQFASAITTVRAERSGGGGNLLQNSELQGDPNNAANIWGLNGHLFGWTGIQVLRNLAAPEWKPTGAVTVGVIGTNTTAGQSNAIYFTRLIAVVEGQNVIGSAYLAAHRSYAYLRLLFRDAAGAEVHSVNSAGISPTGGQNLANWIRSSVRSIVPAGATNVEFQWWTTAMEANPYAWLTMPMVEIGAPEQVGPSPWSPGAGGVAAVTQSLQVGLNATTGRLNATYGIAVAANGRAVGMRIANDGVVGRIEFEGDSIAFLPPNGASNGIEFTPGNTVIRQFGSGWQRIQSAIPFGPDNLVMYFGPNVGLAAASKALATKWEDANGDSYTGGTFTSGLLKNSAQSSVVSPAASVETGNFGTNGGVRVITSSMSYDNSGRTASNLATIGIWADVVIERSRDSGATWQQVTTYRASGARTNEGFEPGLGYSMRYSIGGSATHNDATGGTQPCNYRARIYASSGDWPFTLTAGGNNRPGTQRLIIQSMEG